MSSYSITDGKIHRIKRDNVDIRKSLKKNHLDGVYVNNKLITNSKKIAMKVKYDDYKQNTIFEADNEDDIIYVSKNFSAILNLIQGYNVTINTVDLSSNLTQIIHQRI